jgi:hypothetical protein
MQSLGSAAILTVSVAAQGWQNLPVTAAPTARSLHASAYDTVSQQLVISGPPSAGPPHAETIEP